MAKQGYMLPLFAFWSKADWQSKGSDYDEIRDNMLGWDITDFGSGDFYNVGLLLFTLRNGNLKQSDKYKKPYAEKIMVVRENQVTPMHYHYNKMEDIINRGGGNLMIQLCNRGEDDMPDMASDVQVYMDGRTFTVAANSILKLQPGESITLPQFQYHSFWGEEGSGTVLVGEVSMVNDDTADNRFANAGGRFPAIEEDAEPLYLLATDYN